MNSEKIKESIAFLKRYGIPDHEFAIYEEKEDAICLEKVNSEWLIYYSERGSKYPQGWAKDEIQALELFCKIVLHGFLISKFRNLENNK